jgi:hypothetical protein
MLMEVQSWPYNFPESDDFPKWDERGNVSGRLLVKERCVVWENIFQLIILVVYRLVVKISNKTN